MDLLHISQKIREIRQAQGMTVEQLASRSGVSKGFISQVENFRTTPSLKVLQRIADALGVDMSGLFQSGDAAPACSYCHLDEGEELVRDDNLRYGMRYLSLAYRQIGRQMNPFIVEYRPGEEVRPFLMHDTEEFFVLLEGEVICCAPDETQSRRMTAAGHERSRGADGRKTEALRLCVWSAALKFMGRVVVDQDAQSESQFGTTQLP